MLALIPYLAAVWIVWVGLYRFRKAWRGRTRVVGVLSRFYATLPGVFRGLGLFLVAGATLQGAPMFFQGSILTSYQWLAYALAFAGLVEVVTAIVAPRLAGGASGGPGAFVFLLVGAGLLYGAFYLHQTPGPASARIHLAYPVRGQWRVISGGRTALTNYHYDTPTERYAVDLVHMGGETEGQPVYAPVDGLVIDAVNDREHGRAPAEGNVVVIRTDAGVEVWLSHLQQGSVEVQEGDVVEAGQEIARCGDTGNPAKPQLQIHAQKEEYPVPMVFGDGWRFLVRNDRIANF